MKIACGFLIAVAFVASLKAANIPKSTEGRVVMGENLYLEAFENAQELNRRCCDASTCCASECCSGGERCCTNSDDWDHWYCC